MANPGNWYKVFESVQQAEQTLRVSKSMRVEAGGLEICFARTANGFFAVNDVCPHLGDSLSRGTCNYLGEVVCPWHSYRFDLATGEETTGHGLQVRTYPVKVSEDGVFIELPG